MVAIRARGLRKSFRTRVRGEGLKASLRSLVRPEHRTVEAVRGIDFEVGAGEMLAFIGPNGAGKSTTIKMLTGIVRPDGGEAAVLGLDPARKRKELAFRIGSVFGQKSQLWFHLPATDSFRLLGAIYEIERPELARRTAELAELFGLGDFLDAPVRKLSLGQRIRCEIASSLLHRPEVLFLDEPTIGLDVVVKQEIRELLLRMNREEGTTVFLTSHDAGDIEKLCERAIIIHHGGIVLDRSVKELKRSNLYRKVIDVKWAEAVDPSGLPGVKVLKAKGFAAKLELDAREAPLADLLPRIAALGEVLDITIEDEPLEDIIADIYRAKSKEEADALANRGA